MKTRVLIGMAVLIGVSLYAQEFDDMYFRSKDRESLQKQSNDLAGSNYNNFKKKHFDEVTMLDEYANPSDSYSARSINPEYIARSNSKVASEDESNYFVENYTPQKTSTLYNSGYYSNNLYNQSFNPYYASGWYAPSYYNSFNNPYSYYGGRDPWLNPYWYGSSSSWSLTASYFWGNSWGMGWNYGLGYSFGNPYYGNSWGTGWYNPCRVYYPYPTTVVYTEVNKVNYGKRPSNSSATVGNVNNHYVRTNSNVSSNSSGRSTKVNNDYYVRPSRRTYSESSSSSSYSRFSNPMSGSSRFNSSGSSLSPSRSSGFSSPSRSSSYSGGSMSSSPSRSSSPSSSGSGSSSSGSRRGN